MAAKLPGSRDPDKNGLAGSGKKPFLTEAAEKKRRRSRRNRRKRKEGKKQRRKGSGGQAR
jgi:hypothetical protein